MTAAAIVSLLAEVSWRAVVVAALVGVALTVWRVRSGAVRHAAWTAVAIVFLLMPVLLPVTPVLTIPVAAPLPVRDLAAPDSGGSVVSPTPVAAAPTAAPATGAPSGVRPSSPVVERARVGTVGRSDSSPSREAWLVAVWVVGMSVSLVWLAVGWRWARRLAATGRVSEVDPRVYESPALTSPCAVGVWRGRVLVPSSWRLWPVQRRMMVVTHELAHLERRDGLIALMARLTRAVFWFHPLAWWLERRIAVAAEQACDERVLDAGHDPDAYAELLVEMASQIGRGVRRVAWQRLGMAGGRQMGHRIDAVLAGPAGRMSTLRAAGVAGTVFAVAVVSLACRPAQELTPDDGFEVKLARDNAAKAEGVSIAATSPDDLVREIEALLTNPTDATLARRVNQALDTRHEWRSAEALREPRRRLVHWFIEHQPDSPLAEWPMARRWDPDGFDRALALWQARARAEGASVRDQMMCVRLLAAVNPEAAERWLADQERRLAGQPEAARTIATWRRARGELYAAVAVGVHESLEFSRVPDGLLAATPLATRMRLTLDRTQDAEVLWAAGQFLNRVLRAPEPLPFNVDDLSRRLLRRSLDLDPSIASRIDALDRQEWHARLSHHGVRVAAVAPGGLRSLTLDEMFARVPPEDLFVLAADASVNALNVARSRGILNRTDAMWQEHVERARKLSDRALALADEFPDDGDRRRVEYAAHLVRGSVAALDGATADALAHLEAAVAAAEADPVVALDHMGAVFHLSNLILHMGKHAEVAAAFERLSKLRPGSMRHLADAAAAIREGRMPEQYQLMVSQLRGAR